MQIPGKSQTLGIQLNYKASLRSCLVNKTKVTPAAIQGSVPAIAKYVMEPQTTAPNPATTKAEINIPVTAAGD